MPKRLLTLPNCLTLSRIAIMPLLGIFLVQENRLAALTVLVVAAFTDFLDGYLARRNKEESKFGKLMDPVADKIMLCVTLFFLVADPLRQLSPWLASLLVAREFLVTGLRAVASSMGVIIAAGQMGKLKTVLQFLGLGAVIYYENIGIVNLTDIGHMFLWTATLLSYWSMWTYVKNAYRALAHEL
ncbi:MAG TPA: CDP-diacylglycerol--glycerol-3-phosphate 3-phosphatidyltransferase [Bdellovibrionota bacterium]|nr:CDP-diacylglycerol--glycerol-3-phosphate 3-phosphatidyltransferase [Bdellovibrionota bacterium]